MSVSRGGSTYLRRSLAPTLQNKATAQCPRPPTTGPGNPHPGSAEAGHTLGINLEQSGRAAHPGRDRFELPASTPLVPTAVRRARHWSARPVSASEHIRGEPSDLRRDPRIAADRVAAFDLGNALVDTDQGGPRGGQLAFLLSGPPTRARICSSERCEASRLDKSRRPARDGQWG